MHPHRLFVITISRNVCIFKNIQLRFSKLQELNMGHDLQVKNYCTSVLLLCILFAYVKRLICCCNYCYKARISIQNSSCISRITNQILFSENLFRDVQI